MQFLKASSLVVLLLGALCVAAGAPVAMRVEVEPLRGIDDETLVAVIIQVSPEDRSRIGANAMVRLELDGGAPSGVSPLWAVRVASDGSARVEVPWPPGEHDLRVEIMSPSGEDTGLWVGRVRIPIFGSGGDGQLKGPPVEETPLDDPPPRETAGETPPSATTAAGTITAGRVDSVRSPTPDPARKLTATEGEPEKEAVDLAETPPAPAALPTPVPVREETPLPTLAVSEAAPTEAPLPTAEIEEAEPVEISEPTPAPPPVVEPLRQESPPPTPARAEPIAAPVAPLAAYEAWEAADPETMDLTVVVMRDGNPVQDLGAEDLRLRVEGDGVTIEDIGDAGNAPLLLGLAVDLSPAGASEFEQIRRYLRPLARRATDGRGRLFAAATGGGEGSGWSEDASPLERALRAGGGGNLPELVETSLALFKGQRARTFLVVLTDGRSGDPTKAAWKEAAEAAADAGVPVLVMALWNNEFSQRTRKNLQQLAGATGGRLFLAQGIDQLPLAVERYLRVLDSGVALRFRPPTPSKEGVRKIAVEATEKGVEVQNPRTIR